MTSSGPGHPHPVDPNGDPLVFALAGLMAEAPGTVREYAIDVSSPGIERPVRTPEHFRNAIGRQVTLRTPERKRLRGEIVSAGEQSVVVRSGDDTVEIPYDQVVRGNLVYEQ